MTFWRRLKISFKKTGPLGKVLAVCTILGAVYVIYDLGGSAIKKLVGGSPPGMANHATAPEVLVTPSGLKKDSAASTGVPKGDLSVFISETLLSDTELNSPYQLSYEGES